MKTPVISCSDYIVYIEPVEDYWFIHMDVFRWTKQVKHNFMSNWTKWTEQNNNKVLLAMPFIDDTKMAKWINMTGFKLIEHHKCTDGVVRKLYKWGE